MIPPRWHADGCWVCNSCGSRRARWNREDGPEHHNRDCAYSLATFADRPLADAPRVAAVTPAADVSRDPAAPEKHGGGGSSWAADVEAEWRAERAMSEAIAEDERAAWATRIGLETE